MSNWTTTDVKAIRESLQTHTAYLNRATPRMFQEKRTRVYDARRRGGQMEVKLLAQHWKTASGRLIGSGLCWCPLERGDTISIYGGTAREVVLAGTGQ